MLTQLYYHIHSLTMSGLIIMIIDGIRWVIRRVFCTLVEGGVGLVKLDNAPCCVLPYIFREYTPVIKIIIISARIKKIENDTVAVINIISLNKLMDGGAAILIAVKINHHIVILGINIIIPFIRNILRVCRIS